MQRPLQYPYTLQSTSGRVEIVNFGPMTGRASAALRLHSEIESNFKRVFKFSSFKVVIHGSL
jgi:hypothetical protein